MSIQDVSGARIFSEVVSLCLLFTVELCAELLGSVLVMLYVYRSLLKCAELMGSVLVMLYVYHSLLNCVLN